MGTVTDIVNVVAAIRLVEDAVIDNASADVDEDSNPSPVEDPLITGAARISIWMELHRFLRTWQPAPAGEKKAKETLVQAIDGAVTKVVDE